MIGKPREKVTKDKAEATGATLIAEERARQLTSEGWTAEHDDQWTKRELLFAAVCYIFITIGQRIGGVPIFSYWPWDRSWLKQSMDDPARNLVKAGALIAAEIDRMKRSDREKNNER